MNKLLIIGLIGACLRITDGYGQGGADSSGHPEKRALIAEMAQIIKEYAFFNGGTVSWRYDSWPDTTKNLRLYVAENVTVLGDRSSPEWYYIDFGQPIIASELTLAMGKNDNFTLALNKVITRKVNKKKERNKSLTVFFFTDKNKRTTDFGELYNRLTSIIDQLVKP